MAGMIASNMPEGVPPGPPSAPPTPPQGGGAPEGQMPPGAPAGGEPPVDGDEAYDQAMTVAMEALYKQGAAKAMAKQLASAPDLKMALAEIAYKIVEIVDERTGGDVPDELLASLAAEILNEVAEIAEAAGAQVGDAEVAGAMKQMAIMYAKSTGGDASQLEQAMNAIPDEDVARQAAEGGEAGMEAAEGQHSEAAEGQHDEAME